jgi:hypothetical protein
VSTASRTGQAPQHFPSEELVRAMLEVTTLCREGVPTSQLAVDPGDTDVPAAPKGRRIPGGLLAVLLLGTLSLAALPFLGRDGSAVPAAVTGRWVTEDARYRGRAMVLTSDSVTLVLGDEGPTLRYPVRLRRARANGAATWYDLEYDTPEGVIALAVSVERDQLRLRNRDTELWRRSP